MKVLVACEESQAVCKAFREKGHAAYSCDIVDCSGGHPEWHIKGDVLEILNPTKDRYFKYNFFQPDTDGISFETMDGQYHQFAGKWDMILAFPPCTFLTNTGNRWFDVIKYGYVAQNRWLDRCKAIVFFLRIAFANCEKIVLENPIGCMNNLFRKPDQIIHPYYFAEFQDDVNCERKSTCLWLKGVNPLKYEVKYTPRVIAYKNGKGTDSPWHMKTMSLPPDERAKARSKTFPGIAKAMAEQWGGVNNA